MDSKDKDSSKTTGESPAQPGSSEYRVTEYHMHAHMTMTSFGQDPECREALDRLYHYLDGELTEDRRRQIKEHLDKCMPCLEAFDFEAELKMLIARRCRDEVPLHLRQRVIQALADASVGGFADDETPGSGDERTGAGGEGAD